MTPWESPTKPLSRFVSLVSDGHETSASELKPLKGPRRDVLGVAGGTSGGLSFSFLMRSQCKQTNEDSLSKLDKNKKCKAPDLILWSAFLIGCNLT